MKMLSATDLISPIVATVWLASSLITHPSSLASAAEIPSPPARSTASIPDTNLALSPETSSIEEGKALYENGQMIAALGKFMTVLRKDPHNTEARQYLRMIIDIMRQNPAITSSKLGSQEQAIASNPVVQEEIRRMLQLRSSLTLDLKAIPSVQIKLKGNVNQVWIETPLLFADNSGGLKEQGIPILDRVAAWLKTYGQQPVIIHCYPEELQETSTTGSLFLHRYSELFNFFVEEKKMPAQRFVSADLLKKGDGGTEGRSEGEDVSLSSGPARIVIETIGTQTAMLDAMPSMTSTRALSQWLENSILPNRKEFNPEEGEWVSLDLAALSRAGIRTWSFKIVSGDGKEVKPAYFIEGKGNLLKRLSWDGHDQKTGDFVRAGNYLAKLQAVNADGTIKNQEEILQVLRTTKEEPVVLVDKPKPHVKVTKKPKAKVAKKVSPAVVPAKAEVHPKTSSPAVAGGGSKNGSPTTTSGMTKSDDSDSLVDSKPAPSSDLRSASPQGEATQKNSPLPGKRAQGEGTEEDGGDSVHAIWKQVIQFEPGQSDLKPTVKASLERIGKTLEVYPLQKVRITGFAMTSEANAGELAHQRAEAVRSILVEEYHVDKKRVIVAGGKTTTDENASKVEMSITN